MSIKKRYSNKLPITCVNRPIKMLGQRQIKQQRGFVLLLSLVILTMLTLVGVSSMNSSSVELKATANSQQHQIAQGAVYSMLQYTLSEPAEGTGAGLIDYQDTTKGVTQPQVTRIGTYDLTGTSNLSASVTYIDCLQAHGGSLEAGKGFAYSFFTVEGSGSNATGTSTSLQTQVVRFPAASC